MQKYVLPILFAALISTVSFPTMNASAVSIVDLRGVDAFTGDILTLDPSTGAVLDGFPGPHPPSPDPTAGLTFAENGSILLFQSPFEPTLFHLDPDTGAPLDITDLPLAFPGGLSFETGAGELGVDAIFVQQDDASVFRQDGYNGPINLHLGVPTIPFGALGGDDNGRHFVIDAASGIVEFDPFTPESILNVLPGPTSDLVTGLAFDGTSLYVSDASSNLYTIDPDTGAVLNTVTTPLLSGLAARTIEDNGALACSIEPPSVTLQLGENEVSGNIEKTITCDDVLVDNIEIENDCLLNLVEQPDGGFNENTVGFIEVITNLGDTSEEHCTVTFTLFGVSGGSDVVTQELWINPQQQVAGETLPMNTSALMIAGLSSMSVFMIPAVAGVVGAAVYLMKHRANKE